MKRKFLSRIGISFVFLIAFQPNLFSQKDSAKIKLSGYIDAYYAYYTDSVGTGNYQQFPSISPRSNEFGLNTAMLTAQYDAEKIRGLITIHYGDVPRCAWSSTFNPIMEAHLGIRLCKKIWFDAGFFRTHFGTEGLLPKESFTSSVSVNTYYEPYFESGFRLNYNPSDKISIFIYALNGYNRYEDNNDKKAFGMLATYAFGDKGNVGYSNYIGDDSPQGDTVSHLRIHQNLFFNYQFGKLKIQIGGDLCMQKNSHIAIPAKTAMMQSGVASLKYQAMEKCAFYARYEFFNDPQGAMSGIIIDKNNMLTGLKLWGATVGMEFKPSESTYIKFEARQLMMDKNQEIFHWHNAQQTTRMEILCNMGISF